MKQFSPKLLFILIVALLLSFCSEPVKVGEDANRITIVDAWIDDVVDEDSDGYASYARLYFEITAEDPVLLYAIIGQRNSSESGQYSYYKETITFDVSESRTLWIALGDEGFEIPMGCYDLSLQIFDANDDLAEEVLLSVSAENDDYLADICMETPEEDQPQVELIFNNECHTDVLIDIAGYGSITIPGNSSNTYDFSGNPGSVTFNGATQIPVGGNLTWTNRSVDLTGLSSETYRLWYGETIFYATIMNSGGSALSDFYVNYSLDDEFFVDVFIPNDSVTRPFGYYNAHPETEIWVWSTGAEEWYVWSEINYTGGENQVVTLTSSLPKAPGKFTPNPNVEKKERYYIEAQ